MNASMVALTAMCNAHLPCLQNGIKVHELEMRVCMRTVSPRLARIRTIACTGDNVIIYPSKRLMLSLPFLFCHWNVDLLPISN